VPQVAQALVIPKASTNIPVLASNVTGVRLHMAAERSVVPSEIRVFASMQDRWDGIEMMWARRLHAAALWKGSNGGVSDVEPDKQTEICPLLSEDYRVKPLCNFGG